MIAAKMCQTKANGYSSLQQSFQALLDLLPFSSNIFVDFWNSSRNVGMGDLAVKW